MENLKSTTRKEQYQNMLIALKTHDNDKRKSSALTTSKKRSLLNSYVIGQSYKKQSKVAFIGEQYPYELLYTLNLIPINVEMTSILVGRSNNIQKYLELTIENNLSRDVCSNLRSTLGLALANCFPQPDFIFAHNYPCDGGLKLLGNLNSIYKGDLFVLDTPQNLDVNSISYVKGQLMELVRFVEKTLNCKIDNDRLKKTIENSNQARKYFLKTLDLAKNHSMPLILEELFEIGPSSLWGLKEFVNVCKSLYEDAENQKEPIKKKRLLWMGQFPSYSNLIIDYLKNEVEILYYIGHDPVHQVYINENDPYASFAQRSIMVSWESKTMLENVEKIVDDYHLDGLILLNPWGCRNLLSTNPFLSKFCQKRNLKYLTLDIDYMDENKFSFSNLKNRIDAFLELINI